jgi:acetyl-CoA acyltransferase
MKAVLSGFTRSPFHFAKKGAISQLRPDDLAAQVVRSLITKTRIDPSRIDDVILGCAYPEASQGNNLARIVGLLAGLPVSVGGMTVNRFCGSSMQAIHIAASQIEAGMGEVFLCVGVESMSMVPQGGFNYSPNPHLDETTAAYISMGETAENVAKGWDVSRLDQEELAVQSHRKAAVARAEGLFKDEIAPITTYEGIAIEEDGCILPSTSAQALAGLKPVFRIDGVVTAGTSSPLTDGAVAVLVTSEEFAIRNDLNPTARVLSFASVGVEPDVMGIGPVPASRLALKRAGIAVDDLDVVEINEAFASQALACIRELDLSPSTVNIDGGGLAIGHPLGATGARITGKAASLLARLGGTYALATQCVGGGQGIATVLERYKS